MGCSGARIAREANRETSEFANTHRENTLTKSAARRFAATTSWVVCPYPLPMPKAWLFRRSAVLGVNGGYRSAGHCEAFVSASVRSSQDPKQHSSN